MRTEETQMYVRQALQGSMEHENTKPENLIKRVTKTKNNLAELRQLKHSDT